MKKQNRRRRLLWLIPGLVVGLPLLAFLLYQIPWVHKRLEWRLDAAFTYLRLAVNPVGALPSPQPTNALATNAPLPAATLTPTPEFIQSVEPAVPTATRIVPTPIPGKVTLDSPPFDRYHDLQDWNNCGPATLALYLRFYGWKGDQFTISDIVKPIRADRNVNTDELQYYVRNYAGWLGTEFRVGGDLDLLKHFIAAGYPIMIEESFLTGAEDYWANDDHWTGHYLLLTGYDDSLQIFISQDTMKGADQVVNYKDVDRNWQAFNRIYMVIYPIDQVGSVQAILGDNWDADVNRQHALAIAELETKSDPNNAFAWFNLGSNLTYFDKYSEAAAAYDKAREIGLPQRMLRYQFGPFIAYFNAGRIDDLLTLTEYALSRTENSEEALVWHGWALYREGDSQAAGEEFHKALDAHPGYQDALYALNYLGIP